MARLAADYDSASSQFFIVHKDSPFLDGQYAVFGYVTEGIEVIDKIVASANPIDNDGTIIASEQPVITSIKVIEWLIILFLLKINIGFDIIPLGW